MMMTGTIDRRGTALRDQGPLARENGRLRAALEAIGGLADDHNPPGPADRLSLIRDVVAGVLDGYQPSDDEPG
jgi:hypothetical protein